jgi:hypothetical protein
MSMTMPALVLAVAMGSGSPAVPADPPFVVLWHTREACSGSSRRVIRALWPDGRWLGVSDTQGPGNEYVTGRIDAKSLQKFVCEFEATGLWLYSDVRSAGLGPFEGLTARWQGGRKEWTCPLEPAFSDCMFEAFTDVRKALLAISPAQTMTVSWDGLPPASWTSDPGGSHDPPRCRQILDPAAIRKQLRPGNEREVLASLSSRPGRWSVFLDGIVTAEDVWLELADRLIPASDGGSAWDLGMAVGQAFLQGPERVLRRFGAQAACGSLGFDQHRELALDELKKLIRERRALAAKITTPDLRKEQEACLVELDQLEADIERIYR